MSIGADLSGLAGCQGGVGLIDVSVGVLVKFWVRRNVSTYQILAFAGSKIHDPDVRHVIAGCTDKSQLGAIG